MTNGEKNVLVNAFEKPFCTEEGCWRLGFWRLVDDKSGKVGRVVCSEHKTKNARQIAVKPIIGMVVADGSKTKFWSVDELVGLGGDWWYATDETGEIWDFLAYIKKLQIAGDTGNYYHLQVEMTGAWAQDVDPDGELNLPDLDDFFGCFYRREDDGKWVLELDVDLVLESL